MRFTDAMERVEQGFEVLGVAVLVVGLVWSSTVAWRAWRCWG